MLEPCELHEVSNCSICTGVDKKYEASLELPSYDRDGEVLPVIPGGPTIWSKFPGTCTSCGRRWQDGEPIHHPREGDGWIGVACCVDNR